MRNDLCASDCLACAIVETKLIYIKLTEDQVYCICWNFFISKNRFTCGQSLITAIRQCSGQSPKNGQCINHWFENNDVLLMSHENDAEQFFCQINSHWFSWLYLMIYTIDPGGVVFFIRTCRIIEGLSVVSV